MLVKINLNSKVVSIPNMAWLDYLIGTPNAFGNKGVLNAYWIPHDEDGMETQAMPSTTSKKKARSNTMLE